ncbi:MAG: T9SS sorting signal type C domain-containing protein, partial [Flavobacterium sp.]
DSNITVSGIGRGSAIFGLNANDRYDAKSWGLGAIIDLNSYFEFIIIPNTGKEIDFVSFVYTGQISDKGPTLFALRSSVDNFTSNIGLINGIGGTVSLSSIAYQNVTTAITFRIYGWNAPAGTGTFSINDFTFNGVVSCSLPKASILPETNMTCSATSFDLSWFAGLFATNYFIDVATDSGFIDCLAGYQNKELGNVLSETISNLLAGKTYYVRMRSENDCGVSTNSNVIEVASPLTVYNGSWSNGVPDANKNVLFLSNYNVDLSLEACSCYIATDVQVHVDSDSIFKLQNDLDIIGNGSLTFENDSSFIQVNDEAVNTGIINYKRETSPVENFDYVYWSSPVKNLMLYDFSPNSDKYYSYAKGNWIQQLGNNTMEPAGKGFIIRVPKLDTSFSQTFVFNGVPNNGVISVAVEDVKSNLIGNPYPSAIDADLFIEKNESKISSALYFWTHNTKRHLVGSQYVYSSNDYATYTKTGGVGTDKAKSTLGLGSIPCGKIAAGQSFFVSSNTNGFFEFNNSMRIGTSGLNSQFFKQSNTKKINKVEKNRVWLNLTNDNGAFKQLLVGYVTGATNGFDNLYDGVSISGNSFIDFYSLNDSKDYTIQGRALPFNQIDEVPLGYKTSIAGMFQISIDNLDGIFINENIYLEDRMTNTIHDLKSEIYSFITEIGTFNNRFVLRYTDNSKLFTNNKQIKEKGIIVSVKNRQIKINSFEQIISSIKVYDLKGSLIYKKNKVKNNEFIITQLQISSQVLIVKIELEEGKWVSEKVIFDD